MNATRQTTLVPICITNVVLLPQDDPETNQSAIQRFSRQVPSPTIQKIIKSIGMEGGVA